MISAVVVVAGYGCLTTPAAADAVAAFIVVIMVTKTEMSGHEIRRVCIYV